MLPPGIVADALPPAELARMRTLLPGAQTAATLRVGSCSCDLVRPRHPNARDDEREHRRRYTKLGLSRERIIRELERHRRKSTAVEPEQGWAAALAAFVSEHARNAGPTLYQLSFEPSHSQAEEMAVRLKVAEILAGPGDWLREGHPVLVVR